MGAVGDGWNLLEAVGDGGSPSEVTAGTLWRLWAKAVTLWKPAVKAKAKETRLGNTVVYLIKCPSNIYYVGKTKRALKTRSCEHKCSIRNFNVKS